MSFSQSNQSGRITTTSRFHKSTGRNEGMPVVNSSMDLNHKLDSSQHAEEQVQILLESLAILAKLAKMETADYQSSLKQGQDKDNKGTESVYQLQKSLDDLQRQWRLEDTFVVQLCTAIHRFHSTIDNLQKDAEDHTATYNNLVKELQESQKRNSSLERALIRLNAKNQKLTTKVKQRSCEKRSLVKHVQDYVQQVKEAKKEQKQLKEENVVYQLHAHEHFLQQQRTLNPLRVRSFSHEMSPRMMMTSDTPERKARGMSQDSNFSNFDALDFVNEEEGNLCDRGSGLSDDDLDDNGNEGDDAADDISCYSTACSVSSLVTDDGVATLRLTTDNSPLAAIPVAQSSSSSQEPPIITLSFPSTSSIGLQFEKLPLDEHTPKANKLNQTNTPLNREKGVLMEALLCDLPEGASPLPGGNDVERDEVVDQKRNNGFNLSWNNVFGKIEPEKHGIFVVSGFQGFNDEQMERPNLGARLLEIDGDPVDENWSLDELHEKLTRAESKIDDSTQDKALAAISNEEKKFCEESTTVTLTIGNEPLSEKQKGILAKLCEAYNDNVDLASNLSCKDITSPKLEENQAISRFHFLKRKQGPASPLKGNLGRAGSKTGSKDKHAKDNDQACKQESKLGKIAGIPSFFSKRSSKESNNNQDPSEVSKEEEEIQLSSPGSSPASSAPLFQTEIESKNPGGAAEQKCPQDSVRLQEEDIDKAEDNRSELHNSSTFMSLGLFSPGKFLSIQTSPSAGETSESETQNETNHDSATLEDVKVSHEAQSLSSQSHDDSTVEPPVKSESEIVASGSKERLDATMEETTDEYDGQTDSHDKDPAADDRLLHSVKKIFTRPFG